MSVLEKLKRILFVMGSVFASLFLSVSVITTPVFADPTTSTTSDTTSTTETPASDTSSDSSTTQTTDTCYDESGSLGWLVCPSTGFLAKATDALYGIIEDFLVVEPLSSDTDNPFHQVWEIFRDITNIVFVIFLLIVIYSQLTGVGISNYGIKKVLPKIIVSAILINLSYIICALFVDLSNIIGASLKGLFSGIESSVTATGMLAAAGSSSTELSYSAIVGALLGTVAIGGIAIGAAGGLGYLFFSLIPVLLGAVVAVFIAFITISARQAFVYLLIMISPLAFVCSLLPNTEKWFDQWKKSLTSMLFFYPMFSALFGACSLVGWVIIASAEKPIMLVFGMAIKVVPLFMSWSLLKMSGTLPGQISAALTNLTRRPLGAISNATRDAANLRRAEYTARKMQQPFNFASGGSWRARNLQRRYNRQARLKTLETQTQGLLEEERMARLEGKRIVGRTGSGAPIYAKEISGYDNNGRPIYRDRVNETKELRSEFTAREIGLRNAASKARIDNVMSTMGTYLEQNGVVVDSEFGGHIHQQGQNYLELMTQAQAKRRNDIADKRFYANSVRTAGLRDAETNELIDREAYDRLITRGAGADAYVSSTLTGEALREAETQRNAALMSVQADAIDAIEAERKAITAKYTTYMGKQVTKEVLRVYEQMLEAKDIEGICAAQNTLAMRGDYDKIVEHLQEYMDREGYVELGTDFANVLALNLLGMKDADPELARLGKHINVETWAYTDGSRHSNHVTFKEFMTGKTDYIDPTTGQAESTKYYAKTLLQGTGVKGIDRTFYGGLDTSIDTYFTAENYGSEEAADQARKDLMYAMLPQIISALPGFAADSEQILNTLNFLTGMKNKNGKWKVDRKDRDSDEAHARKQAVYDELTASYLKGLTANDLIGLKTNTYDAILARFATKYGYDAFADPADTAAQSRNAAAEERARADLRDILQPQINALRTGDQAQLAQMKTKIRTALGLL